MRPEETGAGDPEPHKRDPLSYLAGAIHGFQIGREHGFGEGVAAMHRAIARVLRNRGRNGGLTRGDDDD